MFLQIFNFIPFISSIEEQAYHPYVFEKTRVVLYTTFMRNTKVSSYKCSREQIATFASQRILEFKIFTEKCPWATGHVD